MAGVFPGLGSERDQECVQWCREDHDHPANVHSEADVAAVDGNVDSSPRKTARADPELLVVMHGPHSSDCP